VPAVNPVIVYVPELDPLPRVVTNVEPLKIETLVPLA